MERMKKKYKDIKIKMVKVKRYFQIQRREEDIEIKVERKDKGRIVERRIVDYKICIYENRRYMEEKRKKKRKEEINRKRMIGYVEDMVINKQMEYEKEIRREWKKEFEV